MQICIVEICEPNHYSAVIALAETYAVNATNQVIIYTLKEIAPLLQFSSGNISVKLKEDNQDIAMLLQQVNAAGFDRIHLNTVSKFYREFAETDWKGNIFFTIHNIDNFLANKASHRTRLLLFDLLLAIKKLDAGGVKYALKNYVNEFKRQRLRNTFIKKVMDTDFKILVYSKSQEKYLLRYVDAKKIVVFPFCLYGNITDTSSQNTKLRVCIPGTVSSKRRNYTALVTMIRDDLSYFRRNVTFDMLGYIPANETSFAREFEKLRTADIDIIFNTDFVTDEDFDNRLGKADIILGNLNVQLDPYRKYGETKETGVIFNVIKAGKPVILPRQYPVDDNLKELCIFFDDYEQLGVILKDIVSNKQKLNTLKHTTLDIVKKYNPRQLYHLLAS